MRIARYLFPLFVCALTACGSGDAPSGGLNPDQNETLDKSAQKLDAQRADLPKRGGDDTADKAKKSAPPAR